MNKSRLLDVQWESLISLTNFDTIASTFLIGHNASTSSGYKMRYGNIASALVMFALTNAAFAVSYSEIGDAGELLATAQVPTGSGSLTSISGTLINTASPINDDIDLYKIHISDPNEFSVTVSATLSEDNDAMMFLFDSAGAQILFNDDGSAGNLPQFNTGDLTGNPAGNYYLAFNLFETLPNLTAGSLSGWNRNPDPFQTGPYTLTLSGTEFPKTTVIAASVLPTSRSVQVGNTATAFFTIINAGTVQATGCTIAPLTAVSADFSFQTTDPSTNAIIGSPNTPVDIQVGASQSFVFSFTPNAPLMPTNIELEFDCTNTNPAATIAGINTLLLSASSGPVADIIALAATLTGDGIVHLPASTGSAAFAVATVNVGSNSTITVSADTGSASLPVSIALCETDPATGACINPTVPILGPVTTSIAADATPTFAFFVTGTDTVPFDPANHRIFVRFEDAGGVTRGATSVAVRTL